MVSVAAGLAASGKTPFIYTIIPFLLMRTFEQVRNDVCMQEMNVKIIGIGGGLRYSTLGSTHHAIEDIAAMKVLPSMTIVCPADPLETQKATEAIYKIEGPVYLRMGTTKEASVYDKECPFELGRGHIVKPGHDISIIATGSIIYDVLQAARILKEKGIDARVIDMHTIKPMDKDILMQAARETKAILTVEEHSIVGGLGESVAAVILENGGNTKFKRMGIEDHFCSGYGPHEYVKAKHGLGVDAIAAQAADLCK